MAASERVSQGEAGPILIGSATEEVYVRLCDGLSSSLRLDWEQRPNSVVGDIRFFGDTSGVHEKTLTSIRSTIDRYCLANDCFPNLVGSADARFEIPVQGTFRTGPSIRVRNKAPDGSWTRGSVRAFPLTVVEVVYRNETDVEFIRKLEDWALAGANAIGVSVYRPSSSR